MPLTINEEDDLAYVIAEAIKAAQAPLLARIAELESRQAIQEAKCYMNFRGTYVPGTRYLKGDVVLRQSSQWIALEATSGLPGGQAPESRSWQLCLKSEKA